MDLTQLPVTLVIKAPNQRIGDHTVECMLGWTVKKLKRHLEEVYPSKPKETHQKLIYSGKLLQDHLLLKDVIRQDETQTHHTVHLVCSQLEPQERPTVVPESVSTATPTVNTMPNTEGLRYRSNNAQPQQNNSSGSFPNMNQDQPQMPHMNMTQEQYMMMMQTYYNQMAAQYMQYYQTGGFPAMAGMNMMNPTIPTQEQIPTEQIQQNNVRNQARDNNDVILDARGRVVDNVDNDDDFGHDWLDYVYTFSRFMVLISIVYFYSNFTRFAVVALFFFIVYLYQTGFFRVRRREPAQQRQAPQNPDAQEQQQQENNPTDSSQEENSESSETTEEAAPEEPPKPSPLSVAWSFFTTFFSSLIPQPPPAVNAN